jgi:hypothetical protein
MNAGWLIPPAFKLKPALKALTVIKEFFNIFSLYLKNSIYEAHHWYLCRINDLG